MEDQPIEPIEQSVNQAVRSEKIQLSMSRLLPGQEGVLRDLRNEIDGSPKEDGIQKRERELIKYTTQSDHAAFTASEGTRSVGYVEVRLAGEESPIGITINESLGHLTRIGVLSEMRGKGIGKQLIARAEAYAHESGKTGMWLDYLPQNIDAARLYDGVGYTREGSYIDDKGLERIVVVKNFVKQI